MEALSVEIAQIWSESPSFAALLGCIFSAFVSILGLQQWRFNKHIKPLNERLWQAQQRTATLEIEQAGGERELILLQADASKLQALQQQHLQTCSELASSQASQQHLKKSEVQLQQRDQQLQQLRTEHETLKAQSEAQQQVQVEQLNTLKDAKLQLTQEFELLANRIFDDKQKAFGQQSQSLLANSVNPLREQLTSFRKKVEDVYEKENAERNQLVGQIAELQKQTQQIGSDAMRLASALKGDNKAQGNWGEVVLERLLEESGLQKGREYDVQVALKSEDGRRRNPDVIIRLPERKDIIIDSKMSLAHYERYCSAADDDTRAQMLKLHIQSVRSHIAQLSVKNYEALEGVRTLDFVFIFMPVEAAFMLALQHEPALFREAYERQVILVSPTTLLATLRTVENIWRYEKQNSNAEEIARQAGGLYDQFVLLLESMDEAGRQIEKAGQSFETAQKRLGSGRGNLLRRVENIKQLGAKAKKQIDRETLNQADLMGSDEFDAPKMPEGIESMAPSEA
mgnify:CR=1 FL=1